VRSQSRRALGSALVAGILVVAMAGSINAESASISASVRVVPLEITLDLSTTDARVGDAVKARATITNAGPTRLSNVTAELHVDASAVSVRGSLVTTISRLQPGRAVTVSWTLCPTMTGNVLVLARASVDGASVDSDARLLTVTGQRRGGCS
jgi:subtilase family serine protease